MRDRCKNCKLSRGAGYLTAFVVCPSIDFYGPDDYHVFHRFGCPVYYGLCGQARVGSAKYSAVGHDGDRAIAADCRGDWRSHLTFEYPQYFKALEEDLNPGLAQTLQSAFRGNFQNVNVVEAERAAAGADLFASPALTLTDPMKLTVTFVDPRSRPFVAEFSSERSCDGNAPGVYDHIGTDLVLFAAVVVFPPADRLVSHEIDKHTADRFNAAFAPAIAPMAGDIALKASRYPHLQSFAKPRLQSVALQP